MAEKRANIDIIFRNGLRDYEVLPPQDVWENIKPVVSRRQFPLIFFRYAAAVALMISVGFLTFKWGMSLRKGVSEDLAYNAESENSMIVTPLKVNRSYDAVTIPEPAIARPEPLARTADIQPDEQRNGEALNPVTVRKVNFRNGNANRNLNKLILKDAGYSDPAKVAKVIPLYPEMPQQLEVAETRKNKWSLAALVSPTYYSGINTGNNAITSQLVSEEQPVMSYSGGLALSYNVNKRLSVQSGIYYSSLGNQISGISSFSGFQRYDYTKGDRNFEVQTTNGKVYTSSSDIFLIDNLSGNRLATKYTTDVFDPAKANLKYLNNSLIQNFGYLELPVYFRYKVVDKTLGLNLIGGLSSNFLVNNAVYSSQNGDKTPVGKTEGLNMVSFSSSLGMGMEYSFGTNISLNLEPTFRYFLNPYSGADGLRTHPFAFGIFSGFSYKF